ncbi:MAG: hypothetical protein Q9159_003919 [Coniocarpon cinnabarinum]
MSGILDNQHAHAVHNKRVHILDFPIEVLELIATALMPPPDESITENLEEWSDDDLRGALQCYAMQPFEDRRPHLTPNSLPDFIVDVGSPRDYPRNTDELRGLLVVEDNRDKKQPKSHRKVTHVAVIRYSDGGLYLTRYHNIGTQQALNSTLNSAATTG